MVNEFIILNEYSRVQVNLLSDIQDKCRTH